MRLPRSRAFALVIPLVFAGSMRVAEAQLRPFSFRKSITIDRTKVPSGCGTTLANFPMLYSVTDLDLRTTANGGDVTDPEGDDILFRALDDATCGGAGTAPCTLDHEIESYTALSGQLVAWVRIPSLKTNDVANTSDTVIYIYYGSADITTSIQNANGVWDTNFKGEWHLKETTGGAGAVKDSTSNVNHGTDNNGPTFGQAGKIGDAISFDGLDDYVNMGDTASLSDHPLAATAPVPAARRRCDDGSARLRRLMDNRWLPPAVCGGHELSQWLLPWDLRRRESRRGAGASAERRRGGRVGLLERHSVGAAVAGE